MEDRFQAANRTAAVGIVSNILLLLGKLTVGFITRSQAMIADGFNSAGDVFASVTSLVGSSVAAKPQDADHQFGHGKAEYIASMFIGLSMLAVAVMTLVSAVRSIWEGQSFAFSPWLVAVAIITILLKLSLYLYTSRYGKKYNNFLVLANAEDHRNDVFVTTGTLIGILFGLFGIYWVDGLVGILISVWIGYTGGKILWASFQVLLDRAASQEVIDHLTKHIDTFPGVSHIDSIQSTALGARYLLIIKISVDPNMTVLQSHEIAGKIRSLIRDHPEIADAVIHINPDLDPVILPPSFEGEQLPPERSESAGPADGSGGKRGESWGQSQ